MYYNNKIIINSHMNVRIICTRVPAYLCVRAYFGVDMCAKYICMYACVRS